MLKRTPIIRKEPKPKICKYEGCTEIFKPIVLGQKYCVPHLIKNQKNKDNKKEKKDLKEKLKTLSDYEKEAKAVFQKWVRLRDLALPCISCGKYSKRYDGGHYFDAGIYSGVIFHEFNVNKQCSYNCNKMKHGNKPAYRIGLIKKIGEENVKALEDLAIKTRFYKYTKFELIEIKEKYQQKIKEILKNTLH